MNTGVQIFLRTGLKLLAGWLISKGILEDSQAEEFIGGGLLAAGMGWAWLHHSQAKAQGRKEASPVKGIEVPKTSPGTTIPGHPFLLWLVLPAAMMAGCALNTQYATTTSTNPTNGVVTVTEARSRTIALGDAKTVIDKTRASAGKTSSVGASGLNEEATTGNIATNLSALTQFLNALKTP